jgi:hypothetical protein
MRDQGHLEDTMAHEMVHAYDHLRFKLDWDNNLRHAACTEVSLWNSPHHDGYKVNVCIDSSQLTKWRVPMGSGVLQKGSIETDSTTSGVRETKSNSLC